MYQRFAAYQQWKFEVLEIDASDTGGYKVGWGEGGLIRCDGNA